MTLSATCHCGAVRIEVLERPQALTNCNCSVCRRYGDSKLGVNARNFDPSALGAVRIRRFDGADTWTFLD